jgi:hypothetical protein
MKMWRSIWPAFKKFIFSIINNFRNLVNDDWLKINILINNQRCICDIKIERFLTDGK